MNKKMTMILGGAGVGAALLLAPLAGADTGTPATPTPNPIGTWGSQVTGCMSSGCYPASPAPNAAGQYYSGAAQNNPYGPGFGGQLLAKGQPGASTFGTGHK
jgi:hypothetical protein